MPRIQAAAEPFESEVLSKAFVRAAEKLGLSQRSQARILGLSTASLSRLSRGERLIDPDGKEGELALLLVRLYRSLDALTGGDEAKSERGSMPTTSTSRAFPRSSSGPFEDSFMSSSIWTRCGGASNRRRLALQAFRTVEATHRIATRKLTDSDEEQILLERMLERSKPPVREDALRLALPAIHAVPLPAAPPRLEVRYEERAGHLVRLADPRHVLRGGGLLPVRLSRREPR